MVEEKKEKGEMTRRQAIGKLTAAGAIAAVGILAGAGGYLAGKSAVPAQPTVVPTTTVTTTKTVTETVSPPKPGEDLTIAWIGGAAGDPFDLRLFNGATHASDMLGISLKYIHTEWSPEEMVTEFKNAIALNPNGIVIMAFAGYEANAALLEEAAKKGIYVSLANVNMKQARERWWYIGYTGIEPLSNGYNAAMEAVKRFDLKSGDRAGIMSASFELPVKNRAHGLEDGFNDAGLIVDRIVHPPEVYGSPTEGIPYIVGYYNAHPDVSVIVLDGGGTSAAAVDYMEALGLKPGDKPLVGFDLTEGSLEAVKEGYMGFVVDQQPYLQGFMPVLNLFLSIKYGFQGYFIDTGGATIDSTNVEFVEEMVNLGIR